MGVLAGWLLPSLQASPRLPQQPMNAEPHRDLLGWPLEFGPPRHCGNGRQRREEHFVDGCVRPPYAVSSIYAPAPPLATMDL
eukprot:13048445-Alexandrium_andersonii.AAC.1